MTIFVFILLLLVIICFVLILNSSAEIEKVRTQNKQLLDQMTKLRSDYETLLKTITSQPAPPSNPNAPQGESADSASKAVKLMSEKEKLQVVKNNAYKIQNILEGYAYDHGGYYSPDLKSLDNYATNTYMNEVVTNPYTNKQAYVTDTSMCIDISLVPADEGITENKGKLLFQANPNEEGKVASYTIAALNGDGFLIKDDNDNVFTLSNSVAA